MARKSCSARTGVARDLKGFHDPPDTLFGCTYMVLAPEHPLVNPLTTPNQREAVAAYKKKAAAKSDLERTDLAKEKSGVFTGSYAIKPGQRRACPPSGSPIM